MVDEALTTYVDQVGTVFIVRQIRADALRHHHDQRSVIRAAIGVARYGQPARNFTEATLTVANGLLLVLGLFGASGSPRAQARLLKSANIARPT
ncbi:MAG TPA: hypothetical protein VKB89_20820 [Xanthobacteraceae bacterium]|nr:hypothetical protein [Xanthobacteraceae bacterium]